MNKQGKILLGCLAALLILSGGLAAAMLAPDKTEEAAPQETLTLTAGEVDAVTVTNGKGSVRIVKQDAGYGVEGLEELPPSENAAVLAGQAGGLEAIREIPATGDLAQFGLSPPETTAAIEFGGEKKKLELGGKAPGNSGRYAAFDGKVYLIEDSKLTAFDYGPTDYVSVQVSEPLGQDDAVESITLKNAGETMTFSYVPEQAAPSSAEGEEAEPIPAFYRLTAPVQMELDKYDVGAWANSAFGMSAQAVEVIRPDQGQIREYGLDEPETVLTAAATTGQTVTLSASAPRDGICYLMREGVPLIYRVSQADVPWRRITAATLSESVFGPVEVGDVAALEIAGQGVHYRLTRENGKTLLGEKGISQEAYTAIADAALHVRPEYLGEAVTPTLEPALTITVAYSDRSRETDTLHLIPTGNGSLYLQLNGQIDYTAQESQLQSLLTACETALSEPVAEQ